MSTILSVGTDAGLLQARHGPLQEAASGSSVTSAQPDEAFALLQKGRCDLLVVCHSVSDTWVERFARYLGDSLPSTWALVLGRRHRYLEKVGRRVVVVAEFVPSDFLADTAKLLLRR